MKRNWKDFQFGVSRLDRDDMAAVARAFGIGVEDVEALVAPKEDADVRPEPQ